MAIASHLMSEGWRNGTLFSQVNPKIAVYPGNDHDQNVFLYVGRNNWTNIGFYTNHPNRGHAFPLIETILGSDSFQSSISCMYPMSGQYGTLNRVLFYVLLLFSLVFRRHAWLSVAALGTAMTYAAVSALHLFALIANYSMGGGAIAWNSESAVDFTDIDFQGIFPILSAAGIMLTPILMWSVSVRKHHAQAVVLWWGVLIFAALSASLIIQIRNEVQNGTDTQAGWAPDVIKSFVSCVQNSECPTPPTGKMTLEAFTRCNCIDFCGTLSPRAPMRTGSNMAPIFSTSGTALLQSDSFDNLFGINIIAAVFMVINGVVGLLECYSSQAEVRNTLFWIFNMDSDVWIKLLFEGQRQHDMLAVFALRPKILSARGPTWRKVRYIWAKTVATSFFLTAVLLTIACPAVFITSVVANELYTQSLPVGENSDAVGAWGSWVGAFLVIIAAIISKYGKDWLDFILIGFEGLWRLIKYARHDRPKLRSKNESRSVRFRLKLLFLVLMSPFIHCWFSIRRTMWTAKINMQHFAVWWSDTEAQSQLTRAEMRLLWEAEEETPARRKLICQCRVCEREREPVSDAQDGREARGAMFVDPMNFQSRRATLQGGNYEMVESGSRAEVPDNGPIAIDVLPPPASPPSTYIPQQSETDIYMGRYESPDARQPLVQRDHAGENPQYSMQSSEQPVAANVPHPQRPLTYRVPVPEHLPLPVVPAKGTNAEDTTLSPTGPHGPPRMD